MQFAVVNRYHAQIKHPTVHITFHFLVQNTKFPKIKTFPRTMHSARSNFPCSTKENRSTEFYKTIYQKSKRSKNVSGIRSQIVVQYLRECSFYCTISSEKNTRIISVDIGRSRYVEYRASFKMNFVAYVYACKCDKLKRSVGKLIYVHSSFSAVSRTKKHCVQ